MLLVCKTNAKVAKVWCPSRNCFRLRLPLILGAWAGSGWAGQNEVGRGREPSGMGVTLCNGWTERGRCERLALLDYMNRLPLVECIHKGVRHDACVARHGNMGWS